MADFTESMMRNMSPDELRNYGLIGKDVADHIECLEESRTQAYERGYVDGQLESSSLARAIIENHRKELGDELTDKIDGWLMREGR